MSKQEKHSSKKRPMKINVASSAKPSEYKRVSKLLEHKGLEISLPESHQQDLFEAISVALGGQSDQGKALSGRCLSRLREWFASQSYPKGFEYLAEVKPFLEFYSAFPGNILFEGVNLSAQFEHFGRRNRLQNPTLRDNGRKQLAFTH